jgi:hypothetical protein
MLTGEKEVVMLVNECSVQCNQRLPLLVTEP